jgi:hypothetical protein
MADSPTQYVALVESFGAAGSSQLRFEGTFETSKAALAAAEEEVQRRREADVPGISMARASTVEEWQAELAAHRARMWSPRPMSRSLVGAARLPREASSAKEAKEGQHNNDDDDDPKPVRHVILSLGACRLYGEPIRFATCAAYGRNRAPLDEHGGARLSDIAAHLRQGDYRRNG